MAQAARKKSMLEVTEKLPEPSHIGRLIKETLLIMLLAIAAILVIALSSYNAGDPGWSYAGPVDRIANRGGYVGAWIADVLLYLFGYFAYLFPGVCALGGLLLYRERDRVMDYLPIATRSIGFFLALIIGSGLAWAYAYAPEFPHQAGGIVGHVVGVKLLSVFGVLGGTLLMIAMFLTSITLLTGFSWLWLMDTVGRYTLLGGNFMRQGWLAIPTLLREFVESLKPPKLDNPDTVVDSSGDTNAGKRIKVAKAKKEPMISTPDAEPVAPRIRIELPEDHEPKLEAPAVPPKAKVSTVSAPPPPVPLEKSQHVTPPAAPVKIAKSSTSSFPAVSGEDFEPPSLDLLDPPKPFQSGYTTKDLEDMSAKVVENLKHYSVDVSVEAVQPGPVITRFELQPAPGVKASRITNLAKDLARSLSTTSVRVVEVIPGKTVVGLEIPNQHREIISLRWNLNAPEYQNTSSPLVLALGKDISGRAMVADLAKMPHLLVAGTTGSGKSVALNAMVLSLLYGATPEQVRVIMIDPKMLELSVYEGIPHLLTEVVTDMKDAANALRWSVGEMERRYKLMSALKVRNIAGYNDKVKEAIAAGKPLLDPLAREQPAEPLIHLPYIVVIVDELADMMMTVGKKVEELIARLAQKARAAGIHLILATQRPSVDVITGLIKANIPTRIAFQVSSRVDSRTILDQIGAETLLGHGDMLYLPPGTGIPIRIHGAFVSDQEVNKVVEYLKGFGKPDYIDLAEVGEESSGGGDAAGGFTTGGGDESDPLYDEAVKIVTETRRASVSGVQRRLKIGYNRAARLVEDMERAGVVGALQSNGFREVLAPPPPRD